MGKTIIITRETMIGAIGSLLDANDIYGQLEENHSKRMSLAVALLDKFARADSPQRLADIADGGLAKGATRRIAVEELVRNGLLNMEGSGYSTGTLGTVGSRTSETTYALTRKGLSVHTEAGKLLSRKEDYESGDWHGF
jgi:hypothetical protein